MRVPFMDHVSFSPPKSSSCLLRSLRHGSETYTVKSGLGLAKAALLKAFPMIQRVPETPLRALLAEQHRSDGDTCASFVKLLCNYMLYGTLYEPNSQLPRTESALQVEREIPISLKTSAPTQCHWYCFTPV